MQTKFYTFIFVFLVSIQMNAQIASGYWTDTASTSSTNTAPKQSGISFVIGNFLYIGFGQDASNPPKNDMWKWDITNMAAAPVQVTNNLPSQLTGRVGAFVFVINGKAYIGGGYDGTNWCGDFYQFDPLNTVTPYTAKGNLPHNIFFGAAFSIGGYGYAGMGNTSNYPVNQSGWYKYDPNNDTWTTMGTTPVGLFGASAFTSGTGNSEKGYVCFGCTAHTGGVESNAIYEYDPNMDVWTTLTLSGSSAQPAARAFAGSFTLNNKYGVVVGGGTYGASPPIYDDAYAFDPATKTWITLNSLGYAPANDVPRKYVMSASDPASRGGYISGGQDAAGASGTPRYSEIIEFTYSDVCNVIATAGSNSPDTVGQTLNLSATGGGSYSWSGPDNFTSTQQNPTISITQQSQGGTYSVTVTDASNCTATAQVNVTVVTATGIDELQQSSISLYPNPGYNELFFNAGGVNVSEVKLYSVTGNLVAETSYQAKIVLM